jgi:hypothetical protein
MEGYKAVGVLVKKAIAKVKSRAKARARTAAWNANNPGAASKRVTTWRNNNRDHWRDVHSKRRKTRYHSDEQFNILARLRTRLYQALRKKGVRNKDHVDNMYGCTHAQLKDKLSRLLEPGQKLSDLSIDHIFPMHMYDLTDQAQCRMCMHWSNLQPLKMDGDGGNRSKSGSMPSKAVAMRVKRECWPDNVTESDLSD